MSARFSKPEKFLMGLATIAATFILVNKSFPDVPTHLAAGAQIAALGNTNGAVACASCHAFNGVADPSGGFPRLAGLSEDYIRNSLEAFANGGRKNALMSNISKSLSAQEQADVAEYYSSLNSPIVPAKPVDQNVLELGRIVATVGLNGQQIPACDACHGPLGQSTNPEIPSLQGQYSRYIEFELRMFREGSRQTGAGSMSSIAHSLTTDQSHAVAAYFQQVRAGSTAIAVNDPTQSNSFHVNLIRGSH